MKSHVDPLAHHDPDRHPTHGPLGPVYTATYLIGFFLLAPACAIGTIGCIVNRSPLPAVISFAAMLFCGALARAAWYRMP